MGEVGWGGAAGRMGAHAGGQGRRAMQVHSPEWQQLYSKSCNLLIQFYQLDAAADFVCTIRRAAWWRSSALMWAPAKRWVRVPPVRGSSPPLTSRLRTSMRSLLLPLRHAPRRVMQG